MGFLDKILGRDKKAAGDAGDASMRQERESMAEDRPAPAEGEAHTGGEEAAERES